ncbi:MAG: 50S ribosomal protein L11 methyltransferase [Bacteroidales bacterium]
MNYYQVNFFLSDKARDFEADLLKNDLLQIGFDSFVDITYNSFEAYCPEKDFSKEKIPNIIKNSLLRDKDVVRYEIIFIKDKNWNKIWEQTSLSVQFGTFCHIRKSDQLYKQVKYDIIINPEQSFGTANHPTTYMIIEYLSTMSMQSKNVMDMGCGTAVLGILCKKMGADYVECVDIDKWAYENAKANAKANAVDIVVKFGGQEQISDNHLFDIFIANINLNILLSNMSFYTHNIKTDGLLILSGFYEQDIKELEDVTKQYGLTFLHKNIREDWALLVLKKI